MTFCATCLLGLEGLVANELRHHEIENVRAENGRVLFDGDMSTLARANICSRYAERIHILVAEFRAVTFEQLFENVKKVDWSKYIKGDEAFPVKGSSINSKLNSIPACQKIIKKAVVESLRKSYVVDWFEETGTMHKIQFLIIKDKVSIMIDTSGDGLHKRGYRENANAAPIRETLAAAMVDLAHVRKNHIVCDPMCGSGTVLIEATLKALNIMPGINRSFIAEEWKISEPEVWCSERERARSLENRDCTFKAYGYDVDEEALKLAQENAEKAGVLDRITFEKRDVADFESDEEYLTVITNPPYGERLLDINEAERLYKIMGERFTKREHYSYTIISPDDDFEKCFGRVADKRRKLYNGMLKCNVYMYYKS
ncbi:MAG: class I SAM-dependent RNA methyltransferase [Ruminococcaceae bacterium]|nr:class I SAM-dependent RNA methyltransferase [Oscillospiraceae bacterium]